MENLRNFKRSILGLAMVTVAILLIPLVAMQFTDEVDWKVIDFVIMGILFFGTGLSYVLMIRFATNVDYRAAVGLALGTTLFMIWANLAVGLIGAGPHPGNLMYVGVVIVGIIGTVLSRFSPVGLARAMYVTSFALVLHTAIALLANMDQYPHSSINEIISVNGFFIVLFVLSGLLFRFAAQGKSSSKVYRKN